MDKSKKSTGTEEQKLRLRRNRYFSEDFKRAKVSDIDRNLITVSELCRQYEVSYSSVYKWIYKYSVMRSKGEKQVVELESDSHKARLLQQKVQTLERIIGQKQIELDLALSQVKVMNEMLSPEAKKKLSGLQS